MKTKKNWQHANIMKEQIENVKNTRTRLGDLQSSALDKENLIGRPRSGKNLKQNIEEKPERSIKVEHKEVQMGDGIITAEDLKSIDEHSIEYWKNLAESHQKALDDSLQELDELREKNEILEQTFESLQKENTECKKLLDESRNLAEVLEEMIKETEEGNNEAEVEVEAEAEDTEEVTDN